MIIPHRTMERNDWFRSGLGIFLLLLTSNVLRAQEEEPQPVVSKLDAIQEQIEALATEVKAIRTQLQSNPEPKETEEPEATEKEESTGSEAVDFDPSWLETIEWRSIGPAAMGGRIVDLAVFPDDPSTFWVATASGGLLKTTNNGITFEHQFDHENTVSIGAVAVAPSDQSIVWVGTGEANPRNSVSYGDGVYKSTDGGKTWTNMGLAESFQIGRIVVHPEDPDVVYVGALGRLYGSNEERGLYKTTDGGETWEKTFYLDDKTGIIDVQMDPSDPETLLVAAYERMRDEFDGGDPAVKFGEKSGIYRTKDGGENFERLTEGLPTKKLGRIGLDFYDSDPNIIFAIVESEEIGKGPVDEDAKKPAYMGIQGEDVDVGVALTVVTPDGPSAKAVLKAGDILKAVGEDELTSFRDLINVIQKNNAGDEVTLKVVREGKNLELNLTFGERPSRGGNPGRPFAASLGGQQANKQDEQGEDGFEYGGIFKSIDGGDTWTRINSLNPRPMYFSQVRVDPTDLNYLYVLGISLHRSTDGGKTFSSNGGNGVHADNHAMWIDPRDGRHIVLGCDGGVYVTYDRTENWDHLNQMALGQFYHVAVSADRLYSAYGGLQDNGTWGGPVATLHSRGPVNSDWLRIGGGDGFKCRVDPNDSDLIYYTSQYGALQRLNLRTGERASLRPPRQQGVSHRYNWNTPFILSNHNSKIYYAAGNYVFKSLDRGNDIVPISPEITRTDRGSATALNESPVDPDVLYVGTDDGKLWVTSDGGKEWKDITENLGLEGPRGISTIDPSRFEAGRCYLAVDGHRNDDDRPLLFVTEDFGETWKSISANLPRGSTRCLREDRKNVDVLYCGTEFAVWFSMNRGESWIKLNREDLPTVAIHEIAQHPIHNEIVVATHGRSLWVADITPIRGLSEKILATDAHLFEPAPVVQWVTAPTRGGTNRRFVGENPSRGSSIFYLLPQEVDEISLKVVNAAGETIRTLRSPRTEGLHQVLWDLRGEPQNRSNRGRFSRGPRVKPGTYGIVLETGETVLRSVVSVEADPRLPIGSLIASDNSESEEELEAEGSEDRVDFE